MLRQGWQVCFGIACGAGDARVAYERFYPWCMGSSLVALRPVKYRLRASNFDERIVRVVGGVVSVDER